MWICRESWVPLPNLRGSGRDYDAPQISAKILLVRASPVTILVTAATPSQDGPPAGPLSANLHGSNKSRFTPNGTFHAWTSLVPSMASNPASQPPVRTPTITHGQLSEPVRPDTFSDTFAQPFGHPFDRV